MSSYSRFNRKTEIFRRIYHVLKLPKNYTLENIKILITKNTKTKSNTINAAYINNNHLGLSLYG